MLKTMNIVTSTQSVKHISSIIVVPIRKSCILRDHSCSFDKSKNNDHDLDPETKSTES